MPCSDSGPDYRDTEKYHEDRNTMTRLACDRCKEIEVKGLSVPAWASEWWAEHKKEDERKSVLDLAEQHSRQIRESALAKLTKQERDELGL